MGNSLLEGLWGHSWVAGSKGPSGVGQHPTRLEAADTGQLLAAAPGHVEAQVLHQRLLWEGPGAEWQVKAGAGGLAKHWARRENGCSHPTPAWLLTS